ncbi:restriction endonuclease [Streptococcus sp. zg-JUN1979]|uniref:restriction endonuclease n=1 Tax=Streptococcus sp. zg-JUN1979 TaxID=3391450 RepID=UPI0039A4AA69
MKNLQQLTQAEREHIVMSEIIKSLNYLGGLATKKDIYDSLKINSQTIDKDYIIYTKQSQKTKQYYKPFEFDFNFAMRALINAKLVVKPARATFALTELGTTISSSPQLEYYLTKLSTPPLSSIEKETSQIDQDTHTTWQTQLLNALKQFSPAKFEQFSRLLIHKMGVAMDEKIGVQISNDGGLDGFGYITSQDDFRTNRVAIQAKKWENPVSSPEIDKFRGAMDKYNAEYGIFITTSTFSQQAIKNSRQGSRVITLIDGDKICELVEKYELYIEKIVTYELGDYYLKP